MSSTLNPSAKNFDDKILDAVTSLSRQPRLTIADVATAAGLPLSITQHTVHTLALTVGAAVDVSDDGTLSYRFPSDTRSRLARASLQASIRMAWQRAFPFLFSAVRVLFGALLIISIVVTFVAIAALSSAARSDDDRRDARRGGFLPVRLFAPDIFDVIFYSRYRNAYYPRRQQYDDYGRSGDQMSFLEAVYSFVFGDGDPNVVVEDRRWKLIAALIRANRGAVTAEQLAPFLDLPEGSKGDDGHVVDEAFVLPVLERFGGYPEVTDDGDIVYVFPSLAVTGSRGGGVEVMGKGSANLVERELQLSKASMGQRAMVVALGVVNVVGVLTLGVKLMAVRAVTPDAVALVQMIRGIYPALVGYATSFMAIPFLRWLRMRGENSRIQQRNRDREMAAVRVSRPDREVKRKLLAAERFKQKMEIVREADVVYSSDKDVIDQRPVQDKLQDDFDRRLKGWSRKFWVVRRGSRIGNLSPRNQNWSRREQWDWDGGVIIEL